MNKEGTEIKKVNTVTYCTWSSIGSVLQSLALFETIRTCGCENSLWLEEWNRVYRKHKASGFKSFLKLCYQNLYAKKIKSAYSKRMQFITDNLNVLYFDSNEAFEKKVYEEADSIYLAGSDQIWNPDLCRPLYFLDFLPKESKKITYAVSMGTTKIPSEKFEKFKEMVSGFGCISAREEDCAKVIQSVSNKEVLVHIDPTFLMKREKWKTYEKKYDIKEKYILLYMLYWDDSLNKEISKLKKKTGIKVYAVCQGANRIYADKRLYDVGVDEFLWLVDHAEYVVTSSFHGVALSVIFNKQFSAVINPSSPSRITNLLEKLDVPAICISELADDKKIDYTYVNVRIAEERKKSMAYLKKVLSI